MHLNQRWSLRRLRVALLCAALGALWLTACDDTLPPISDGRAPDRGATDRGAPADQWPALDGGPAADARPRPDRAIDEDGAVSFDAGPPPRDGCVRPPGGCFSDANCRAQTEVCSTSIGDCLADPCCPQCAVCYGRCIPKPQLGAEIIMAKVLRTTSTGVDTVDAKVDVFYVNQLGGAVSKLELAQSAVVSINAATKTFALSFLPATSVTQAIQPGQSATVSYTAYATQAAPFGCQEQVQLRTMVSYTVATGGGGTVAMLGPIVSPPFSFGCQ